MPVKDAAGVYITLLLNNAREPPWSAPEAENRTYSEA